MGTDRVVVVPPREREDPTTYVAESLALALAERGDEGEGGASPIALPAPALDLDRDADLSRATAAVCVEPEGLARAVDARVPLRIAYLASLESDWEGGLGLAHAVLVPHPALVDAAVGLGARRQSIHVVPALAAPGAGPALDRERTRAELALGDVGPLVVVPVQAMDEDLTTFLVQFALAREGLTFVFDVGRDARAASMVRERAGAYGLDAFMIADTDVGAKVWSVADLALVRLGGPELVRALACGAPLLVLARRGAEELMARPLVAASVATLGSAATLSVALDDATRAESRSSARASLSPPSRADAVSQVLDVIVKIVEDAGRSSLPAGLPEGLLRISSASPRPSREGTAAPRASRAASEAEMIDKELEALRARLADERKG